MINYCSKVIVLIAFVLAFGVVEVFAGTMDDLLMNSVMTENVNMARTAIANGANVNFNGHWKTPLGAAIETKDFEMIKLLVDSGADVNLKFCVVAYDSRKIAPIIAAIDTRNIDIVKYLVEKGADLNVKYEGNGNTPLIAALINDSLPIFHFLLQQNVDVNQGDNNGYTPLMRVATDNSYPFMKYEHRILIAKVLLKLGADPAKRTVDGKTALYYAIKTNNTDMINLLLPISPKD